MILIGNTGKDPEVKETKNGDKVASTSLAVTEVWKDKQGNKKEATEWANLEFWGGLANVVEQWVHKGTKLYVEGKMKTESWETEQGEKRYKTKIRVQSMNLLGGNSEAEKQRSPQSQASNGEGVEAKDEPEDGLPF